MTSPHENLAGSPNNLFNSPIAVLLAGIAIGAPVGFGAYYGQRAMNRQSANTAAVRAVTTSRCLALVNRNSEPGSNTAIVKLSSLSESEKSDCGLMGIPGTVTGVDGQQFSVNNYHYDSIPNAPDPAPETVVRFMKINGKIIGLNVPSEAAIRNAIAANKSITMDPVKKGKLDELELPTKTALRAEIARETKNSRVTGSDEIASYVVGGMVGFVGLLGVVGLGAHHQLRRRTKRPDSQLTEQAAV